MNQILSSIDITTITLGRGLTIIGVALALAIFIAVTYMFINRKVGYSLSVVFTIFLLGPIVSIIVACIGSNIARAISIGGGLALIRFRNTLTNPKDLVFLFLSLASGIVCGTGFIGFGVIAIAILLIAAWIIGFINFSKICGSRMKLKIIVPENIDFYGMFDEILKKYCKSYDLERVKTTDYGTLLELSYKIRLKDIKDQKAFIDDIRTRNGNLNVSIIQHATDE